MGERIAQGGFAGYHDLSSLICFVDFGDSLELDLDQERSVQVVSGSLAPDNTIAEVLSACDRQARVAVTKRIPLQSGLGGASANAASLLRYFGTTWSDRTIARRFGADVPACLRAPHPCVVGGVGERVQTTRLPACGVVLVVPAVGISTAERFEQWTQQHSKQQLPLLVHRPEETATAKKLCAWLQTQPQDFEHGCAEPIAAVLASLRQQADCLLARMTGTGSGCYALTEPGLEPALAEAVKIDLEKKNLPYRLLVATRFLSILANG